MDDVKVEKIWVTPLLRFRTLINQRTDILRSVKVIDHKFIESLYERKRELDKDLRRIVKIMSIYLATLYFVLNEATLEIPLLKMQIGEIPSIIEIATVMLSLNLVFFAVRFMDDVVLRQTIEAVLALMCP